MQKSLLFRGNFVYKLDTISQHCPIPNGPHWPAIENRRTSSQKYVQCWLVEAAEGTPTPGRCSISYNDVIRARSYHFSTGLHIGCRATVVTLVTGGPSVRTLAHFSTGPRNPGGPGCVFRVHVCVRLESLVWALDVIAMFFFCLFLLLLLSECVCGLFFAVPRHAGINYPDKTDRPTAYPASKRGLEGWSGDKEQTHMSTFTPDNQLGRCARSGQLPKQNPTQKFSNTKRIECSSVCVQFEYSTLGWQTYTHTAGIFA